MFAILGVEEEPKRLDPAHDREQIVFAEREHRVDEIVPRALVAQVDFEAVGEEDEEACLPGGAASLGQLPSPLQGGASHIAERQAKPFSR